MKVSNTRSIIHFFLFLVVIVKTSDEHIYDGTVDAFY